jgi:hypothetical protein
LRQQVGIGDAERIASVAVSWPATGQTQTLTGLEPGAWFEIREGAAEPKKLVCPSFTLGR